MFSAFVIVCAASINFEVDMNACLRYNDSWGPYKTVENCDIRSKQMHGELTNGILREYVFADLGDPENIIAIGFCEKIEEA